MQNDHSISLTRRWWKWHRIKGDAYQKFFNQFQVFDFTVVCAEQALLQSFIKYLQTTTEFNVFYLLPPIKLIYIWSDKCKYVELGIITLEQTNSLTVVDRKLLLMHAKRHNIHEYLINNLIIQVYMLIGQTYK